MTRPRIHVALAIALALSPFARLSACDGTVVTESTLDARPPAPTTPTGIDRGDSGLPDGAPKDCFDDPKTHAEIINACTTAVRIAKNPVLPKRLPDGGLPPVP